MDNTIIVEITDHVGVITLNDPQHRNAINPQMSVLLAQTVKELESNPNVHVLIVTGAGSAFCAGANLAVLAQATQSDLLELYEGFCAVAHCILPTIAAVNGPAVGAGLNLALAADIRIAGPSAIFDPRFQHLEIHPGGGMTWMLQRAVGPQPARASLLFGMPFNAQQAVDYGLVLTIAPDPLAKAQEFAYRPAHTPRQLVIDTKATLSATASPGSTDSYNHSYAMHTELDPQALSIHTSTRLEQWR